MDEEEVVDSVIVSIIYLILEAEGRAVRERQLGRQGSEGRAL